MAELCAMEALPAFLFALSSPSFGIVTPSIFFFFLCPFLALLPAAGSVLSCCRGNLPLSTLMITVYAHFLLCGSLTSVCSLSDVMLFYSDPQSCCRIPVPRLYPVMRRFSVQWRTVKGCVVSTLRNFIGVAGVIIDGGSPEKEEK